MLVQMKVEGLLFDPRSGMYILLLKNVRKEGTETLPIWIGKPEADSIAIALGRVATPRPMTHDLVTSIVEGLNASVVRVVITDLKDNTYFATIEIYSQGKSVFIDSRPSDAVAVAVRSNAPIFANMNVIERQNNDDLENWLKNLKPEDFGNVM